MKISTEINSISKIVGREKAIEYVARAGFDAWDFSMFDLVRYDWSERLGFIDLSNPLNTQNRIRYVRELRKIGESLGIHCNQSHAPFPSNDKSVCDCLRRSIELTAEAGGKICIIHPDNNSSPEQNAEFYQRLLPFAKEYGVKIATENMWNWDPERKCPCLAACSNPESFLAHINAVNDEFLVACLDIGHAEMRDLNTSAVELIYALGNHLQALHLHDTDCINDSHQILFSMNIDLEAVAKALKAVGYSGYLTLECDRYLQYHTPENAFEGVCDLANSAKRFRDLFINA